MFGCLFQVLSVKVFQLPMMESGVVKPEDCDTIFVNWKDLIACNNTFLR